MLPTLAGLMAAALSAAEVTVVVSADGGPVADAVVELRPVGRDERPAAREAVMDQVNSEFTPRVLLVPVGSRVRFPNSDRIRHQVYSFSSAKRFELPLYAGTPPEPVRFDTPGVVTLGCNIHDWMKGYIVVTDARHAALSDATGRIRLEVPDGAYDLRVWHERLAGEPPVTSLRLTGAVAHTVTLSLTPPPPPRGNDRLRALQEKFRAQKRTP